MGLGAGAVKHLKWTSEGLPKETAELRYADGSCESEYMGMMQTENLKIRYKIKWIFPNYPVYIKRRWRNPFYVSEISIVLEGEENDHC